MRRSRWDTLVLVPLRLKWMGAILFGLAIAGPASAQVQVRIEFGRPQAYGFSNNYPWFNDVPQYQGDQSFQYFLAYHPDIARALSRNPGLLYNAAWRSDDPALEHYLASHPYVWEALNNANWATGPAQTQWGDYDNQHQWRDAYLVASKRSRLVLRQSPGLVLARLQMAHSGWRLRPAASVALRRMVVQPESGLGDDQSSDLAQPESKLVNPVSTAGLSPTTCGGCTESTAATAEPAAATAQPAPGKPATAAAPDEPPAESAERTACH